jgi:hypothetical protein
MPRKFFRRIIFFSFFSFEAHKLNLTFFIQCRSIDDRQEVTVNTHSLAITDYFLPPKHPGVVRILGRKWKYTSTTQADSVSLGTLLCAEVGGARPSGCIDNLILPVGSKGWRVGRGSDSSNSCDRPHLQAFSFSLPRDTIGR